MKILYKIINTVTALTLIPVLMFLPMFKFIAIVDVNSSNKLISFLGSFLNINTIIENAIGIDIENLPKTYTLQAAYEMFAGESANDAFASIDISMFPETAVKFFYAAAILFAAALVFAVFAIISGLFTKKKLLTAGFSVMGFISTFAASKCFSFVADQLVSGKISVIDILSKIEALAEYKSYIEMIDFDIRIFELASAYTMMLVIFGALILLNAGFRLAESVMPADNTAKIKKTAAKSKK